MDKELRILMLEDSPADAELEEYELRKGGLVFILQVVDTREAFLKELDEFSPDVILSDYDLPTFDGLAALRIAKEKCPDVPFILVTGKLGEEFAIEKLKEGATDYVLKGNLKRLVLSINRALIEAKQVADHKRAEEKFRRLFDNDLTGDFILAGDSIIETCNLALVKIFGYDNIAEVVGQPKTILHSNPDEWELILSRLKQEGRLINYHTVMRRKDGQLINVVENLVATLDANGKLVEIIGYVYDETERRRVEEQLKTLHESMSLAMEASRSGTWDWDIVNNTFIWSPEFLKLFGMPPETVAGFEAWTNSLHPDDRVIAAKNIQDSINDKIELINDYRIILPNQEIRWIRAIGRTFYDKNKPMRMTGICMDITEIKGMEKALKDKDEVAES